MSLGDIVEDLRPDGDGYALVEIETGAPVEEAGHVLAKFNDDDEVVIPPDTDFETYVLYDATGNAYTRESWPEPFSTSEREQPVEKASKIPDWMTRGGSNY